MLLYIATVEYTDAIDELSVVDNNKKATFERDANDIEFSPVMSPAVKEDKGINTGSVRLSAA